MLVTQDVFLARKGLSLNLLSKNVYLIKENLRPSQVASALQMVELQSPVSEQLPS
jgi:hypothetical protein